MLFGPQPDSLLRNQTGNPFPEMNARVTTTAKRPKFAITTLTVAMVDEFCRTLTNRALEPVARQLLLALASKSPAVVLHGPATARAVIRAVWCSRETALAKASE